MDLPPSYPITSIFSHYNSLHFFLFYIQKSFSVVFFFSSYLTAPYLTYFVQHTHSSAHVQMISAFYLQIDLCFLSFCYCCTIHDSRLHYHLTNLPFHSCHKSHLTCLYPLHLACTLFFASLAFLSFSFFLCLASADFHFSAVHTSISIDSFRPAPYSQIQITASSTNIHGGSYLTSSVSLSITIVNNKGLSADP